MKNSEDLKRMLAQIDRKGYPAYKELKGAYSFGGYILSIDHVQGDPFAAPSRVSVQVSPEKIKIPAEYVDKNYKRIAVQDYFLRGFGKQLNEYSHRAAGSGKSGLISISRPGQQVLERQASYINSQTGELRLRFCIGFPANGRTINARELGKIFFEYLPECVKKCCYAENINKPVLKNVVALAEDQHFIREELKDRGLCAFVADGAILPRKSGASDAPMKEGVPFKSPESMRISLLLPNAGEITGMAVKKGITLIVGGGYHGKSTLLSALEKGVYNHIKGDGREYVITNEDAVKVRAEDGRSIKKVDISMFINNLPGGKDTIAFTSENASGSTSQAANLAEAIETGSHLVLIDEDTCATNFMIRDALMERVVAREKEPITPFLERAQMLFETKDISTILVAGSSGAYFHIADTVLQMDNYMPVDITKLAKAEAAKYPDMAPQKLDAPENNGIKRVPTVNKRLRGADRLKTKSFGTDMISIEHEEINLRLMEQLIDDEQTNALAAILVYLEKQGIDGKKTVVELAETVLSEIEKQGLSVLGQNQDIAMVRKYEICGMLNRYRKLEL